MHPWFIHLQDCQSALTKIISARYDQNFLAIGECGLDRGISTAFSLQQQVFAQQIEIAEQLSKPIIIHSVRAFNDILHTKKTTKTNVAWIIHGFNSHPEIAKQLIQHGFYLSFGPALLKEKSQIAQVLPAMPLQQVFFETDAGDKSISAIYTAAAKMLNLDLAFLQKQIFSNFQRVFCL